ncbi:hypothetical protein Dda_6471 [Drechslerella dactyloides]|uniref:Mitochondrial resolvase Ydc2 catalytic domain-containing protein n=1 Tax=Drechslerella dactyloides TaxID=74499 RepID=A0AAD6NG82_DREDA|nr:hypothetical protein Dda_6471 [Drechslerella dactyloides]
MQQRLLSMRNSELKEILLKCGWPVSGTKAAMAEQIQARVPQSRLTVFQRASSGALAPAKMQPTEHRILSLDMGIKNLALSLLKVPPNDLPSGEALLPEILAWQRFSLFNFSPNSTMESKEHHSPRAVEGEKFDFSAVSLSPLATGLARHLVTAYKPTIIAIEKQRYRTMGSAAVQEWTIRVNKLEAMLHAALRVLQEEGIWERGLICSICPQRTTAFWLNRYGLLQGVRTGSATKPLKVKLVRMWLADGNAVKYDRKNDMITETTSMFIKTSARPKHTVEKLDDLADCLLQGLGIIRWEQNRLETMERLQGGNG